MLPSEAVLYYFDQTTYVGQFPAEQKDVRQARLGAIDNDILQLQISLAEKNGEAMVEQAYFKAYGSCATIACGAYLCEHICHKALAIAATIDHIELINALTLQPQERYAALLAEDVWQAILRDIVL